MMVSFVIEMSECHRDVFSFVSQARCYVNDLDDG